MDPEDAIKAIGNSTNQQRIALSSKYATPIVLF